MKEKFIFVPCIFLMRAVM